MHGQHQDILDAIVTTGDLSKDTEAKLATAVAQFTQDFIASKAQGE